MMMTYDDNHIFFHYLWDDDIWWHIQYDDDIGLHIQYDDITNMMTQPQFFFTIFGMMTYDDISNIRY